MEPGLVRDQHYATSYAASSTGFANERISGGVKSVTKYTRNALSKEDGITREIVSSGEGSE